MTNSTMYSTAIESSVPCDSELTGEQAALHSTELPTILKLDNAIQRFRDIELEQSEYARID